MDTPEDGQDATQAPEDGAGIESNTKEAFPVMGTIARGYARPLGKRETQREKLVRIRREFEGNIAAIDEALAVLDRNPGVEEAIIALHRVGLL